MKLRGDYTDVSENFFVFSDGSPVAPSNFRLILSKLITAIWLKASNYMGAIH